ncbi:MAG: prepilin peptidase [bacterium]|nr:prepilin peptidase [bacterium]
MLTVKLAVDIAGIVVAFFIGAFVGNFYHLILYRGAKGHYRLMLPPSCPRCDKAERRIWMLPVLWYPLVRGKCTGCEFPFDKRIIIYEIVSGAVFALLYFYYGPTIILLKTLLFFVFFFVNYSLQFRYDVILARLYLPGLIIGLALSFLIGSPSFWEAGLGLVLSGGFFLISIPFGYDPLKRYPEMKRQILLLMLVGAFLGWQSVLLVLVVAAVLAALIPRLFRRAFGHDAEGVFAGAMFAATLLATFFHADIAALYLRLR